ncbi:MAG: sporulation initiation factor Spo0A C-terminal domain-containing protein, partial [Clostridia bacterium]
MRLLIAVLSRSQANRVSEQLFANTDGWDIVLAQDGGDALQLLTREQFDLLLLHVCLPKLDGLSVLAELKAQGQTCPPRVLLMCEPELFPCGCMRPDCIVPLSAAPERVAELLRVLAQKPLPALAAANRATVAREVEELLDALCLRRGLKGRTYAAWLMARLVPAPMLDAAAMNGHYADCAKAFHTTPAAVERCLRVAVESVFTQGSMSGIERVFGATVDPERGKPTNRA